MFTDIEFSCIMDRIRGCVGLPHQKARAIMGIKGTYWMRASWVLLLLLLLGGPAFAQARKQAIVGGIRYILNTGDNTAAVAGGDGTYSTTKNNIGNYLFKGDVVIPEEITVDGTSYRVTEIQQNAFSPNTFESNFQTWGQSQITSITIPRTVTKIGDYAFDYCDRLKAIVVDPANPNYANYNGEHVLYNKSCTQLIRYPTALSEAGKAYHVKFGVQTFASGAFEGCRYEEVVLPRSIRQLDECCFENFKGLRKVVIPKEVTEVNDYAFMRASNLELVEVEKGNPNYASFEGVLFRKENDAEATLVLYPPAREADFYFTPLTLKWGDGKTLSVKNLGRSAFNSCQGLKKLYVHDEITILSGAPFQYVAATFTWRPRISKPKGEATLTISHWNAKELQRSAPPSEKTLVSKESVRVWWGVPVEIKSPTGRACFWTKSGGMSATTSEGEKLEMGFGMPYLHPSGVQDAVYKSIKCIVLEDTKSGVVDAYSNDKDFRDLNVSIDPKGSANVTVAGNILADGVNSAYLCAKAPYEFTIEPKQSYEGYAPCSVVYQESLAGQKLRKEELKQDLTLGSWKVTTSGHDVFDGAELTIRMARHVPHQLFAAAGLVPVAREYYVDEPAHFIEANRDKVQCEREVCLKAKLSHDIDYTKFRVVVRKQLKKNGPWERVEVRALNPDSREYEYYYTVPSDPAKADVCNVELLLEPVSLPIPSEQVHKLTVTVKDEKGVKISNATVRLAAGQKITNLEGQCEFADLRNGYYTVHVSAFGHYNAQWQVLVENGDASATIYLYKGSTDTPVAADGSVKVKVVDEDGKPLKANKVSVANVESQDVTVDGVTFSKLTPGFYTVYVEVPGYAYDFRQSDGAVPGVEVFSGLESEVTVHMQKVQDADEHRYTVRIRVQAASQGGQLIPVTDATVFVGKKGNEQSTNGEGIAEFKGLQNGAYTIVVKKLGYNSANTQVVVNGSDRDIWVTIRSGSNTELPELYWEKDIVVTVKDNDSQGLIEGAKVRIGREELSTGENGVATFKGYIKGTVSSYTVYVTKEGYFPASVTVSLGAPIDGKCEVKLTRGYQVNFSANPTEKGKVRAWLYTESGGKITLGKEIQSGAFVLPTDKVAFGGYHFKGWEKDNWKANSSINVDETKSLGLPENVDGVVVEKVSTEGVTVTYFLKEDKGGSAPATLFRVIYDQPADGKLLAQTNDGRVVASGEEVAVDDGPLTFVVTPKDPDGYIPKDWELNYQGQNRDGQHKLVVDLGEVGKTTSDVEVSVNLERVGEDNPSRNRYNILVTVQDQDQMPLEGATVRLAQSEKTSGGDGKVDFHGDLGGGLGFANGAYVVHVSKGGYESATKAVLVKDEDGEATIILKRGQGTQSSALLGGVRLQVKDKKTGNLLDGVTTLFAGKSGMTKGGVVAIEGAMPEGVYVVRARKVGYEDLAVAKRVDAQHRTLEVLMEPLDQPWGEAQKGSKGAITVRVLDEQGSPKDGVKVQIGSIVEFTANGETVSFDNVLVGIYEVWAHCDGYQLGHAMARLLENNQNVEVTIRLAKLLKGETGQGIPTAKSEVTVKAEQGGDPVSGAEIIVAQEKKQTSGSNGITTFTGLAQGQYTIGASLEGYGLLPESDRTVSVLEDGNQFPSPQAVEKFAKPVTITVTQPTALPAGGQGQIFVYVGGELQNKQDTYEVPSGTEVTFKLATTQGVTIGKWIVGSSDYQLVNPAISIKVTSNTTVTCTLKADATVNEPTLLKVTWRGAKEAKDGRTLDAKAMFNKKDFNASAPVLVLKGEYPFAVSLPKYYLLNVHVNGLTIEAKDAGELAISEDSEILALMARETGTVTVTATDPDGKVLPRVTVVVTDEDGNTYKGTTRSDGTVTIAGVPTGDHVKVEVTKPGYKLNEEVQPQKVKKDEDTRVEVRLKPVETPNPGAGTGTLELTVTGEDGQPLAHEKVTIGGKEYTTDDEGKVTLQAVPVGTSTVPVAKEGYEPASVDVTIEANKTAEATVKLVKAPAGTTPSTPTLHTVTVKVVLAGATGTPATPVTGATVRIGAQESAKTNSDGQVAIQLPDGAYPVAVQKAGYVEKARTPEGLTVDGAAAELTVTLEKVETPNPGAATGTLELTVTGEDGQPLAHEKVTIGGKEYTTDDGGKVTLQAVPVGPSTVPVAKAGYEPASVDVTINKDKTTKATVKLVKAPAGTTPQAETYTVTVKTQLADGTAVSGATVRIGAQAPAATNSDGQVTAQLPDGAYPVAVQKAGYVEKARTPEGLTVDGQDVTLTVTLEKLKVYLNVFVVDQDLKPIVGADVTRVGAVDTANELTNVNGLATFSVDTGKYDISVDAKGYREASSGKVRVEKNGLDFTFVLQKEVQNNGSTTPVESELLAGVEMYPNPASVATVLHGVENAKRIAVYALTGVQVLSQAVHGEKEMRVSVEHMAEGVYVVIVQTETGESKALKLVVRR